MSVSGIYQMSPINFYVIFFQSPIKPHPIHPKTIYRLWSPVSRKNEGVVMRNSSTNIVTCSGTFSPCGDSTYIIQLI